MRRVLLVLALSGLAAGCAALPDDVRLGPFPACDITWQPPAPSSRGRLLLMAQSVPDASMIPCFGELPPGWEFTGVSTRTSESRMTVETDTFDLSVTIVLAESCDVSDASEIPSDQPGVPLFRADGGETLVYVFDGGCVRIEFPTPALAASSEGRDLVAQVHLMTRARLRTLSGWEL